MDSSTSPLTALQREVLSRFFRRERGFRLSGGGALAGYHLQHRPTDDLDLFTTTHEALQRGPDLIREIANELGAQYEALRDAPTFKRVAIDTGADAVVIDLVLDNSARFDPTTDEIDGVIVDSAREILANKLTTLVGRQEERDLVDVFFLEQSGYRVESALAGAAAKDGGCTPSTLAWLLTDFPIPPDEKLPKGVTRAALQVWRDELVVRLRHAGFPSHS